MIYKRAKNGKFDRKRYTCRNSVFCIKYRFLFCSFQRLKLDWNFDINLSIPLHCLGLVHKILFMISPQLIGGLSLTFIPLLFLTSVFSLTTLLSSVHVLPVPFKFRDSQPTNQAFCVLPYFSPCPFI